MPGGVPHLIRPAYEALVLQLGPCAMSIVFIRCQNVGLYVNALDDRRRGLDTNQG